MKGNCNYCAQEEKLDEYGYCIKYNCIERSGENLYAKHTIHYDNLGSYFKVFSFWIDNECVSWDETVNYCKIIGFDLVDVIYDGIYDKEKILDVWKEYEQEHEGYVIRIADSFTYGDFKRSVAKYVKPEFRQAVNDSHGHWISKKVIKNNL